MPFFDPLPDEPEPPPPRQRRMPAWMWPPEAEVLPAVVPLELALVRSDQQVIWIAAAEVYPEGMAFSVLMCGRRDAPEGVETGSGTWRFGVQFSDGRKATVDGVGGISRGRGVRATAVSAALDPFQAPPAGPILRARGGGGSRSAWRQQYWLWPLPPPGDLLFACEWPDLHIEFSSTTVEADLILTAAARARPMWPDPPDRN